MCNRHADELWQKSRTHRVYPSLCGYTVSSNSGKNYGVVQMGDGRFACTCDWHTWHPLSECSHTLAVREYQARVFDGRTIRAYDNVSAFEQAHQKFEAYNDGVIVTSRVN